MIKEKHKKLKNNENKISNSYSLLILPLQNNRINIERENESLKRKISNIENEISKLNCENKTLKKFLEPSELVVSISADLPQNFQYYINHIICYNSPLSILSDQNNRINNERLRELENLENEVIKLKEKNISLELKNKQLMEMLEPTNLVISQNADLRNNIDINLSNYVNYGHNNYENDEKEKLKNENKELEKQITKLKESIISSKNIIDNKYDRLLSSVRELLNSRRPSNDSEASLFNELRRLTQENS